MDSQSASLWRERIWSAEYSRRRARQGRWSSGPRRRWTRTWRTSCWCWWGCVAPAHPPLVVCVPPGSAHWPLCMCSCNPTASDPQPCWQRLPTLALWNWSRMLMYVNIGIHTWILQNFTEWQWKSFVLEIYAYYILQVPVYFIFIFFYITIFYPSHAVLQDWGCTVQ